MTQFRDGFMMKSPLPKHQQKFLDKARKLSEKSGTPGDYNRDDPKVNEQLAKAEEAEKSHKSDSPAQMKSPLHAPVTATQDITSDMYYQPRNEMDYSTMVAAAGKMGGKFKKKKTKVKSDQKQKHSKKTINKIKKKKKKKKKKNK